MTLPDRSTRRRTLCRPRLEALEDRCLLAAAGTLDLTFAGGGQVFTDLMRADRVDIAVQDDGMLLVPGGATDATGATDWAVARYKKDGSPDSSFGTGGRVILDFNHYNTEGAIATAVALQADGKILVSGLHTYFLSSSD